MTRTLQAVQAEIDAAVEENFGYAPDGEWFDKLLRERDTLANVVAPEWKWEDHPEVCLADPCANGDCSRCRGTYLDPNKKGDQPCGHPCHLPTVEADVEAAIQVEAAKRPPELV